MGDEKEDSTLSVKAIKEKYHNWEIRHLWATRFLEYVLLFVAWFLIFYLIFSHYSLFNTEATSARYMLSALVQSQAAIVAIVVSLTLIAVQLSASAYSPRVIRIFRNNPDVWLLLGLYGLSIFYGLLILKTIRDGDLKEIILFNYPIEIHIISAYFLGIFSFLMLFRYILSIIDLLKLENIINRLASDITKDALLNSKENPIQPIMDIVHGSIMKYDFETMRVGLKVVTKAVAGAMINDIDLDRKKKNSRHFCDHLQRVGKLAISKMDEESTAEVIENLGYFGESTAGKTPEDATRQIAWTIETVGKAATEKGLEKVTWQVALSFKSFGRSTAKKRLEGATTQIAFSLGAVGKAAAEKEGKGYGDAIRQIAWSLETVGRVATEEELKDATQQAAKSLAELTILSEENVKTTIHGYESILEEKDLESFQKIIKIYEQELKELRAKENKKPESR